ncbi:hypothetical protein, partial [Staphylococcus aureus]
TYDIKVGAVGARTKEVEYSVDRSIKEVVVSAEVITALAEKKTIEEIIAAMKDKNREKHGVARIAPAPAARQIPSAVNKDYPGEIN